MRITTIMESKSVKIVGLLTADDFGETVRKQINLLIENDWLPMTVKDTESGDINLDSENYPYEKLKTELKSRFVHEYNNETCYGLRELSYLVYVCKNMVQRIREAIEEVKDAPLEINVDLDSWVDY